MATTFEQLQETEAAKGLLAAVELDEQKPIELRVHDYKQGRTFRQAVGLFYYENRYRGRYRWALALGAVPTGDAGGGGWLWGAQTLRCSKSIGKVS